jgi:cytochrome c biogenesis protein CcmG, thiol:disulfide interchange protein DsbE
MDTTASIEGSGRAATRASRTRTLAVMAITAAIIAAVVFIVNQPTAVAGDVTSITLTGTAGQAPVVGQPAPDFRATTVDGRTVTLSDYRGQPVWLTFGASWCQPCRAEAPDIAAVYEREKASGLKILSVFISEDAAAVSDYANRVGLAYDKVADPNTEIASAYGILGIPSHFFIDGAGVLRAMKIGSLDQAAMEAAIAGLRQ